MVSTKSWVDVGIKQKKDPPRPPPPPVPHTKNSFESLQTLSDIPSSSVNPLTNPATGKTPTIHDRPTPAFSTTNLIGLLDIDLEDQELVGIDMVHLEKS
jgi:hypothetical protein